MSSISASAATIECDGNLSDIVITSAVNTQTNMEMVPTNESINASACAGFFEGNDQPLPTFNTGIWGDGLLNGEKHKKGATWFGAPGAFITEDDLQDLDGDGLVNDPGWIFLGKDDGKGFETTNLTQWFMDGSSFDLDRYLNINFSCAEECKSGDWSLFFPEPERMLAELASSIFGDRFFDHLAFSFKVGKNTIIYDFNFNMINEGLNDSFDLAIPHNFEGEFDLSGFAHDISHISVWARDPIGVTSVDEPLSLYLFICSLLALGLIRVTRKKESKLELWQRWGARKAAFKSFLIKNGHE
ncbi:hypothetical protein [Alteromonas gracilis]|uniref:hypothetical protein n=1 Tax=Alteromonas gracilis TaxID=1479524 RepID=UPI0037368BBE